MPGGWLSAAQVAKALKVTPSRVFQLARAGQLPAPRQEEGARFWHQADVDAVCSVRAGHALSRRGEGLAAAGEPLRRVFDGAVEFTARRGSGPSQVHARVWDGPAVEGRRVVVLIGLMSAPYGRHEDSAMAIARQVLDVPAPQAVWFVHRPGRRFDESIDNAVFVWRDTPAGVAAMGRDGDATPSDYRFVPASFAEIEALVGEPVECYQRVDYSEATIRAWQRTRQTVDVVDDNVALRERVDAIDVLDRRRDEHGHSAVAVAAATLLADQLRVLLVEAHRAPVEQGTEPRPGEAPRTWASRVVAPTPNPTDQFLLDRYPGPFPAALDALGPETDEPAPATTWTRPPAALSDGDQREFRGMIRLLDRVQAWRDDVDEAAFRPDPGLLAALEVAERALSWELRLRHFRAGNQDIPAPPRRSETRVYPVVGPTDEAFLAGLTRVGPDDELPAGPGAAAARRRRLQARLEREAPVYRVDLERTWFGLDPHGHLVAYVPSLAPPRKRRRDDPAPEQGVLAAEWPLRTPHEPIPDDAVLVSDGAVGDRPVYLRWPTGTLTPWPGGPRGRVTTAWNFGPDSDTGLAGDVLQVLAAADATTVEALRGRWLIDQIDHSDPDLLHIRVGDIRTRHDDTRCSSTGAGR